MLEKETTESKVFPIDPDWNEKVEVAKQAREEAQNKRKGKPVAFPMNWLSF